MKFLHFESIIDHVNGFFSCKGGAKAGQRGGKGGAKAGQKAGFRVMLKYFEIKKGFSLLYKTNRFHVAVLLIQ